MDGLSRQVTVLTLADKRPDFISLQARCLQHLLMDDFRFVVLNHGHTDELRDAIDQACREAAANVVHVPISKGDASQICAAGMQFIQCRILPSLRGIAAILDSDMFLLRRFSIVQFLGDHHIAGRHQNRAHVTYIWNGLVFLNAESLPNAHLMDWSCGEIDGHRVDTGGCLYHWLKATPDLRWRRVTSTEKIASSMGNLDEIPANLRDGYEDGFDFEIFCDAFLHYCRGSDWANEGADYHSRKTSFLNRVVDRCMGGEVELTKACSNKHGGLTD